MGKTKGTKRGAEAAADASAKKGRRASEADVALRLGDELGEHTIVSLANIILLKIAADMEGNSRICLAISPHESGGSAYDVSSLSLRCAAAGHFSSSTQQSS